MEKEKRAIAADSLYLYYDWLEGLDLGDGGSSAAAASTTASIFEVCRWNVWSTATFISRRPVQVSSRYSRAKKKDCTKKKSPISSDSAAPCFWTMLV